MPDNLIPLKTALVSVTDKTGLTDFLQTLLKINPDLQLIASGGTARELESKKIPYTPLSEYTGFPEIFNGRVKTLHPKIAGGTLYRKGVDEKEAESLNIQSIDLVICNLYNFAEKAHQQPEVSDLIESIDIGGSTLIRSSCKNFQNVALITETKDYPSLIEELQRNQGSTSLPFRQSMAVKGINLSADYDSCIAKELSRRLADVETYRPCLSRGKKLRYGENPDQEAWIYSFNNQNGVAQGILLAGKPPSFNNYEDATSAYHAAIEVQSLKPDYCFSIIKHGGLCGYATGNDIVETFTRAWEGDSMSAFGSVIGSFSQVTEELIPALEKKFIEVIISPGFSPPFIDWAKEKKPNLRLIQASPSLDSPHVYKNVSGGLLMQSKKPPISIEAMDALFQKSELTQAPYRGIVTKSQPEKERKGLYAFGICAVKYIKSNAIAIVWEYAPGCFQLIGVGGGQPNRIDSLNRLAIPKAIANLKKYNKDSLSKCAFISDGFFPFDDGVHAAAKAGLLEGVQPGGSKRDLEVIHVADEYGMQMVFTGERYFTH